MIASFHMLVCLVDDFWTPEWQKNIRNIARKFVACLNEQEKHVSAVCPAMVIS